MRFNGYAVYMNYMNDGYGGIATLIKSNMKIQIINKNIFTHSKIIQTQIITFKGINLGVINAYCPDSNKLNEDISIQLIMSASKPVIIMGDLNDNHSAWGSNSINSNGRIIFNNIKYGLVNDGSPTLRSTKK